TANCGALTFELLVPGVAAHGSLRTSGVSAIEKFLPLFAGLQALEAARNASPDPLLAGYRIAAPLSIGQLSAGDWPSTVPDLLIAKGRYGVLLDEDPALARAAFEQRVAKVCSADPWLRDHPATVRRRRHSHPALRPGRSGRCAQLTRASVAGGHRASRLHPDRGRAATHR